VTSLNSIKGGPFRTIVADPPWDFSNRGSRAAAVNHYKTMSVQDIAWPLPPTEENAHLYLWTTDAHIEEALYVARSWGFTYKQLLTWSKRKNGRIQMGMGNYWRHCTEHVLFAVRGSLPVKRHNQLAEFEAAREAHSKKPDEFFRLVESMSPGPYLELFARSQRTGWTVWGNEVPTITERSVAMKQERGFFEQVDQLVANFKDRRDSTKAALKAMGWVLRPLSGGGMWRARRWTKRDGTKRLWATTHEELIALVRAEYDARKAKAKTKPEAEPAPVAA
jgi:N6-adenosine-specific RNA methylase IME4